MFGNFKNFKTELTYKNSALTLENIVMRDRLKNINAHTHTYRVIQEESALLWEMIV